jgi:hypothetical protein
VRLTNKPDDANAEIRLDNQIIPLVNDSIFAINTNQLDTGNHLLVVKYISGKFEEEKAFHFSVQPTSALSIKLRNSTPGNNLNDPVTIVADMISGSADRVLYTFSYDREFTRVVEPTSPDNSVTIFPQNQPNVSSWIYARATSDKSCILNNAALDSINISRKPGTGITDPEYPSVMITAGPNPVTGTLIVNGLQTLKTYIVSLYNADGKIMENRRGEHVNRLSLAHHHYPLAFIL